MKLSQAILLMPCLLSFLFCIGNPQSYHSNNFSIAYQKKVKKIKARVLKKQYLANKNRISKKISKTTNKEYANQLVQFNKKLKASTKKHSFTIKKTNGHTRYDLQGDPHHKTQTPHKLDYKKHKGQNGESTTSENKRRPTPMDSKDMRVVKKWMKAKSLKSKVRK